MKQQAKVDQCAKGVDLSRREMLIGTGALMAGMALSQLSLVTPAGATKTAGGGEVWPWPYEKIDPARAGEAAYQAWYQVFCSQAVTLGLFEQLRENVGEPWTSFPIASLRFGMGGMLGWGLTCGAPVASALVIGLVTPAETATPMVRDLLQWYAETPLPVYAAANPRFSGEIPKTTAQNPLCHQSVGRWMKAADRPFGSDERRHRCASVTASVAYRTAELLNDWKDGKYAAPQNVWDGAAAMGLPSQQNCLSCHGPSVPAPPRGI